MSASTLLSSLLSRAGLSTEPLAEDSCHELVFGESLTLRLLPVENDAALLLSVGIAPLPQDADLANTFLRRALNDSLCGEGSNGIYYAYSAERNELLACRLLRAAQQTAESLEAEVEALLAEVENAREEIESLSHAELS